jgi:two-component system, NarL family, response regulator LiaR
VQEDAVIQQTPPEASSVLPLRAIIADDDPFVRRLVKEALQEAGIVVIAEATTGREAVELALYYRPHVVLMDIVMPDMDGITAMRRILGERPEQRVVLLTGSDDDEMALVGLRAGAAGFLTKDLPVEALPRALQAVTRGEAAVSRQLTTQLIEHLRRTPERQSSGMRPVRSPLTNREWEVLGLLAEQRSNAEIAEALVVSAATVRSHMKSILRKLDVHTREEAVEVAELMRQGGR